MRFLWILLWKLHYMADTTTTTTNTTLDTTSTRFTTTTTTTATSYTTTTAATSPTTTTTTSTISTTTTTTTTTVKIDEVEFYYRLSIGLGLLSGVLTISLLALILYMLFAVTFCRTRKTVDEKFADVATQEAPITVVDLGTSTSRPDDPSKINEANENETTNGENPSYTGPNYINMNINTGTNNEIASANMNSGNNINTGSNNTATGINTDNITKVTNTPQIPKNVVQATEETRLCIPGNVHERLKAPIFQSLSDHQISVNTKDEIGTGRYILHKSISAEIVHISEASEFSYTQVVNRIKVYHEVSKIAHANVLKFYGTWVETDVLHLGFEAISDTNLVDYLRQSRQSRAGNAMSTLTNYQLLKLLYEISNGLLHLHNRNIIHGNLQGSVIYLSTDNIPKLSQIANNLVKQEDIECHRWWAPEVFEMERHTKTSDIWAFGVVMWEVATFGGLPYNYIHIKNIQEHTKFQCLEMPSNITSEFHKFMCHCWSHNNCLRPNIKQIVASLQSRVFSDNSNIFKRYATDFRHKPTVPNEEMNVEPIHFASIAEEGLI